MWITGGTLDVYQQLSDNEKADAELTKGALYKAFAMDPCTVYEHFTTWILMAGKTVDAFFAVLKKLALLFQGLPEWTFLYAFMAGHPAQVKQLLRLSTIIKAMPIEHLFNCAWAIIRDEAKLGEPVAMAMQTAQSGHINPSWLNPWARVNCFHCGWTGHIAKDRQKTWVCMLLPIWQIGHIASSCPGNKPGDKMSVPLCFPDKMWTRRNQSSEYTLTKHLTQRFLILAALAP